MQTTFIDVAGTTLCVRRWGPSDGRPLLRSPGPSSRPPSRRRTSVEDASHSLITDLRYRFGTILVERLGTTP